MSGNARIVRQLTLKYQGPKIMIKNEVGKQFAVPEELKQIWLDIEALRDLRNAYVKRPFGFKKALKCSTLAKAKEFEFWNGMRKLYPELPERVGLRTDTWTFEGVKEEKP
jgi:hypothetical protein